MNMENDGFIVIEGIHKNPNNIDTIDEKTKKMEETHSFYFWWKWSHLFSFLGQRMVYLSPKL